MINNKRLLKGGLGIVLGVLLSTQAYAWVNRIVAIVNNDIITQSQLNKQVSISEQRLKRVPSSKQPPKLTLKRQTLNYLINRRLQLQKAHDLGVRVSSQQLAAALARMAQHKGVSIEKLYANALKDGYTRDEFRKEVHDEILLQKTQRAVLGPKIQVTPEQVKDYIHSHQQKLRQMMHYYVIDYWIKLDDGASSKTVKHKQHQAQQVYKKLKQSSQSTQSLPDYVHKNDMGWQKLGQLPTPFVPKLVKMKPNSYSKPIKTSNGFHIVYLKGKRSPNNASSQNKIKQQAQQAIFQNKLHSALINWIAKLRSQAYIRVMPKQLQPILQDG